jgi:hypothetical protein
MADLDDVNDAIATNAAGPRRVQVANQSVEQHAIGDQVAAARHIAGNTAAGRAHFGIRFTKLVPPEAG